MIRLRKNHYRELILVIIAFFSVYIEESIADELQYLSFSFYLINVFLVYILERIIILFFGSVKKACIIAIVTNLVLGIVEYMVMEFRGTPLMPWDFLAISTAKTVYKTYEFCTPDYFWNYLISCILVILLIVLLKLNNYSKFNRLKNLLLLVMLIAFFNIVLIDKLDNNVWDIRGQVQQQGINSSILMYSKYLNYKKPTGYSQKKVRKIIENAETIKGNENKAENVIIIMNESFSDLRVYNNDSLLNDDYMEIWDSLKKESINGNLYVPTFGAGTSETEFEVLTEVSTRYVPFTPYVTAIYHNIDSICRCAKDDGYETVAFHPYVADNWNRTNVYPRIGFDNYYSIDDMDSYTVANWACDDISDFNKIKNIIETRENPVFLFNVTMQNHGGFLEPYNKKMLINDESLNKYPEAKTYLSLIKLSEEAIANLVDYYKDSDEKTLICIFGDHQASIEDSYYEELLKKPIDELEMEENMSRYITPFLIWANYEIDDQYIDKISTNYLGALILLNAGFDLNGYESFNYKMFSKYPVITKAGIIDNNGVFYENESKIDDSMFTDYQYLQYYRMHNKYKAQ